MWVFLGCSLPLKAPWCPSPRQVGDEGAGHFVKMVHNGIEYGDMQLICEAYHLMRDVLGMGHDEMAKVSPGPCLRAAAADPCSGERGLPVTVKPSPPPSCGRAGGRMDSAPGAQAAQRVKRLPSLRWQSQGAGVEAHVGLSA